jgi:hypothetical protein
MYVETIRTIRDYHARLKILGHRTISIIDALEGPEILAERAIWLRKHAAEMDQFENFKKWETSCNNPKLGISHIKAQALTKFMHRCCQEAVGEDGTCSVNTISILPCNVD